MNKTERNKAASDRQQLLRLLAVVQPAMHKGSGSTVNVELLAALSAATATFATAVCANHTASAANKTQRNYDAQGG